MAMTTETTIIRIQEQPAQENQHNALVNFEHGVQYSIQIRDPFADNGQSEKDLEKELEWYFEKYLSFPFTPKVRAQHVAESIRSYGEALFTQVFANADALDQYRQATRKGLPTLRLEIAGSPAFQRLHWEALYDPLLKKHLSLYVPIIRQNQHQQDFPATMRPSPTINVLVVVARPGGARDVGYRTISRPLMDELQKTRQPVEVTLLRPATYMTLKTHLEKVTREHGAGYYHVIHFDVHGGLLSYKDFQHTIRPNQYVYQGRPGRLDLTAYEGNKAFLLLEGDDDEQADLVEASEVADLLRLYQVPIAILNACQSGKYIGEQESSLGSHLITAGVQTVLAMGYSVTVSAAELLMPVLYRELLDNHNLSIALCPARQKLANYKERRAFFNQKIDLEDWVLPIVYQNKDVHFERQPMTPQEETAFLQKQRALYRAPQQPSYGFIGRDLDILQIEKRLLTKRNLLLIRGMGGAGKTTLLHHVAWWWQRTGLVQQVFYFGYDERAWTRQQLMRTIAQKLLDKEDFAIFQSRDPELQQLQLTQLLKTAPHLIILDNLESITGTHLAIRHTLSKKEQGFLHDLLAELVGGQLCLAPFTFVIWRNVLDEYAEHLKKQPTLKDLPFVKWNEVLQEAENWGLLSPDPKIPQFLHLQPVLPYFLRNRFSDEIQSEQRTAVETAFREHYQELSQILNYFINSKKAEDRQIGLLLAQFEYENLVTALRFALREKASVFNIYSVLNEYLNHNQEHQRGQELDTLVIDALKKLSQEEQAGLLGEEFVRVLGTAANRQQNLKQFEIAIKLYQNMLQMLEIVSLDMKQRRFLQAGVYHNFGAATQEQRKWKEAKEYYKQALQIYSEYNNRYEQAATYHQLGIVAQEQREWAEAKEYYEQALQIKVEYNDRYSQAATYHQLGIVAEEQREWQEAKGYYEQALQIYGEYNDRYEQAGTYHQLGRVAQEQREWQKAKGYYEQALQIYREYNDRYAQADTYGQLGMMAREQQKWTEAGEQLLQSLNIFRDFKDDEKAAIVMRNLALLWHDSGDTSLPARLAAVLEVTPEEARDELQRLLEAMGQ